MSRVTVRSAIGLAAALLLVGSVASAQQSKCLAGKTKCVSKKGAGLLKCHQLSETPGKPTDPNFNGCIDKVVAKFDGGIDPTKGCFEKLESKDPSACITLDDTATAEAVVDSCVGAFVQAIDPAPVDQTKCGAGKKKCVSKLYAALLKCHEKAQTPGKPADPNAAGCIDKALVKFNGGPEPAKGCFEKLEGKSPNDCQILDDTAALQALVQDCVLGIVGALETPTTSTTTSTTSSTTTSTTTSTTSSTTSTTSTTSSTTSSTTTSTTSSTTTSTTSTTIATTTTSTTSTTIATTTTSTTSTTIATTTTSTTSTTIATTTTSTTSTTLPGGPCGNGQLDPGEECDGDLLDDCRDGELCNEQCLCFVPTTTTVTAPPSTTSTTTTTSSTTTTTAPAGCGNGNRQGSETCDDGNNEDDDGCPADCRIDACTAIGGSQRFVLVNYQAPPGAAVAGVTTFLDHPEGLVNLPGATGNPDAVPTGTISQVPSGAFANVVRRHFNNQDFAVRVAIASGNPFGTTQLYRIRFENCNGAPVPTPADFRCVVQSANDVFQNPLQGVTCSVTVQ